MKKSDFRNQGNSLVKILFSFSTGILFLFAGCNESNKTPASGSEFQSVVLVADTVSLNSVRIDQNFVNPWGIAASSNNVFWIAVNGKGNSQQLDINGNQVSSPVNIPLGENLNGSAPTGVIYNSTSDFVIPGKGASQYIFCTEDGIISAWNASAGVSSVTVADRSSAGAIYKGLAMAPDSGANFIYVADFFNAKVDVFDKNFAPVTTKKFIDTDIPSDFAPFNIVNIDNLLYVAYAKQLAPEKEDDQPGEGNGFIDIFTPGGTLVKRFVSHGRLNSPWGITKVTGVFGNLYNVILVGNFGDGHINAYSLNGQFVSQMKENNLPVTVSGLWAILFVAGDPSKLYFTSGPDDEKHGAFGYYQSKVK